MRILGGKARGVALKVPASARPSPVRLRKALFDYLRLRYPRRGRFLDLFAGSGAVGLEAASEGWEAVLVEKDPEVIVATYPNALETIRSRPGWSRIQAVRTGRICVYTGGEDSLLSRPGPRVAQALRLLVDCFHGR